MKAAEFDFPLPASLIASEPPEKRDSSRLMTLGRDGSIGHMSFSDLPGLMKRGDMLVLNDTKVFPARLEGLRQDGKRLDILLVRKIKWERWEILSRGNYTGRLFISENLSAFVYEGRSAKLISSGDVGEALWADGLMPLPPYIKRRPDERDKERYQTVYARKEGSIAAPTAGLHFTPELLDDIRARGVTVRFITLHVGRGTFAPVRAEEIERHGMEEEGFEIGSGTLDEIRGLRASGGRLFSVGTTTTRAMEGFFSGRFRALPSKNGSIKGLTDVFIYPGFEFKAVDCLITNFHLPRSTPLMLAGAFAGRENLKAAYSQAVSLGYRFFSYGDAMLIL